MADMNNTQNNMNQGMKEIKAPSLTLNPEDRPVRNIWEEPSLGGLTETEDDQSAGSVRSKWCSLCIHHFSFFYQFQRGGNSTHIYSGYSCLYWAADL